MAVPIPVKGHGKTVQSQGMYDADKDTVDVFTTQDNGECLHLWFRSGKGWNVEVLTAP